MTGQEMMDLVNKPTDGRFIVGESTGIETDKLVSSPDRKVEDNPDTVAALAGQHGLDALIEQGKLRRATKADYDAWIEKASAEYRKFNPDLTVKVPFMTMERAYVVLAPIDLPLGLSGSFFIVPEGITPPNGARGSWVLMMSSGACLMHGTEPCPQ
jgi:hypothetical protein